MLRAWLTPAVGEDGSTSHPILGNCEVPTEPFEGSASNRSYSHEAWDCRCGQPLGLSGSSLPPALPVSHLRSSTCAHSERRPGSGTGSWSRPVGSPPPHSRSGILRSSLEVWPERAVLGPLQASNSQSELQISNEWLVALQLQGLPTAARHQDGSIHASCHLLQAPTRAPRWRI